MKPTMSMALNKEHLDQLLLEYYKDRSELLGELLNQKMGIKNFRSGAFVNKDCDMTQVWKFVLQPEASLSIPKGAEILSVAAQGDDICLWARVNPDAEKVHRTFIGFGTGHNILDNMNLQFIGTALLSGGEMVFHIFEKLSINTTIN